MDEQFSRMKRIELAINVQTAALVELSRHSNWGISDIVFQGGTSLKLAHKSPRFSEDLDFIVRDHLSVKDLSDAVFSIAERLNQTGFKDYNRDLRVECFANLKEANPVKVFELRVSGPQLVKKLRVRLEFYFTDTKSVADYKSSNSYYNYSNRLNISFDGEITTADLKSLFVDKICALGCRSALKYRDVFDVWYIDNQLGSSIGQDEFLEIFNNNCEIYKRSPERVAKGLDKLRSDGSINIDGLKKDMQNWFSTDQFKVYGEQGVFTDAVDLVKETLDTYYDIITSNKYVPESPKNV